MQKRIFLTKGKEEEQTELETNAGSVYWKQNR